MITKLQQNKSGSILILCLWTISLLSVFAVHIGLTIRQRVNLISRVETRSQLRMMAESGINKAVAALRLDLQRSNVNYTPYGKFYRHNNQELFRNIEVGRGIVSIDYDYQEDSLNVKTKRYGFVDEDGKVNVNYAPVFVMARLFQATLGYKEEDAKELALSIVDWREVGDSKVQGFYSDDYYANLEYPYKTKNADFEVIDELLLVKGMSPTILNELRPYLTVYGDGVININTASSEVLLALGLDKSVVDKILVVRRGFDGVEATVDDYIFARTFDIPSEMVNFVELDIEEIKQIDRLNQLGAIKTNSFFFTIHSTARIRGRKPRIEVNCVYNLVENKFEYWREKT